MVINIITKAIMIVDFNNLFLIPYTSPLSDYYYQITIRLNCSVSLIKVSLFANYKRNWNGGLL